MEVPELRITAQTNLEKYHQRIGVCADEGERPAPQRDPKVVAKENAVKLVCLNCTKEKCTGDEGCYRRERDKK